MRFFVLGLAVSGGLALSGAAMAQAGLSEEQIEAAELQLWYLGNEIAIDGVWEAESADALRDYERDWGLEETGVLDADRYSRLTQTHPDTASQWFTTKGGCEVWNEGPQPQEWVEWSGVCEAGRATGDGILTWHQHLDGEWSITRYDGSMQGGRRHGTGLYDWFNGKTYEGDWVNGLREGQGRFTWPDGSNIDGTWVAGQANGEGVATYGNGDVYTGSMAENMLNGHGVMTYADGDLFEGMWKDGRPNGEGTYTAPSGVYSGIWVDGCFRDGDRQTWVETTAEACGF